MPKPTSKPMPMPIVTLITGAILIVFGLLPGFLSAERVHFTAYLPAVFGAILVVLGVLAAKESLRKHVMHAAAVVALILTASLVRPLVVILRTVDQAVAMQLLTGLMGLVYLILCVRSFVSVRLARKAEGGSDAG